MMTLCLCACAGTGGGLDSVSKTNRLLPGMGLGEVKALLGAPSQTQFVGEKLVLKYSLHEYWKGWVPYYLVFGDEPPALQRWYADEAEYQRQQALWMQVVTPMQSSNNAGGAAASGTGAGSSGSGSKAALDACKRKYKSYEDRMCNCYQVCN